MSSSAAPLNPLGLLQTFQKGQSKIDKFGDVNFEINKIHLGMSFDIADLLLIISILLLILAVISKKK